MFLRWQCSFLFIGTDTPQHLYLWTRDIIEEDDSIGRDVLQVHNSDAHSRGKLH